jgi:hypothetical protein
MLKPHDLRHGVAVQILEQHHDLEAVRAMLGHTRIDTNSDVRADPPGRTQAGGRVLREKGGGRAGQLW